MKWLRGRLRRAALLGMLAQLAGVVGMWSVVATAASQSRVCPHHLAGRTCTMRMCPMRHDTPPPPPRGHHRAERASDCALSCPTDDDAFTVRAGSMGVLVASHIHPIPDGVTVSLNLPAPDVPDSGAPVPTPPPRG